MNNRITEIKSFDTHGNDISVSKQSNNIIIDIEVENVLNNLFDESENIMNKITTFKNLINKLNLLHSNFFTLVNSSQKHSLKNEIEICDTQIKKLIKEVTSDIQKIRNIDVENTNKRLKETQLLRLTNAFKEVLLKYGQDQFVFKQKYDEKLKRSYKHSHPDTSDDVIETLIENKQLSDNLYIKKLNRNQDSTLNLLYEEAVETHKDINNLETNLIELQEMFLMLNNLVESQENLIENISNNVMNTKDYVEEAVVNIKSGKKAQSKGGCILLIIIIIIIMIVVTAIVSALVLLGAGATALGIYFGIKP